MTHVRLLPALLIAVVGLFCIKVTHLVANSDHIFSSTGPAVAQEAPKNDAAADGRADANDGTSAEADAGDNADAADTADSQEPPALIEGMKVDPNQSSRSELAILERLARRRETLDEREKDLEMRDALLRAAEKRLQQRVEELKSLEESIKLASRKRREEHEEDLGKLVAMYQSMKPKKAARIFEVLETETLLDVVKIMNPRKVAAIMGEMNAAAAGALSLAIAKGESLEQQVQNMANDELPQIGN